MNDTVTPGIGTLIYASTALPAAATETAYGGLTWTAVGEVTEVPEYGGSAEVVNHTPLATGITQKYHGAVNYGSMQIPLAFNSTDAGQAILEAARKNRNRIAFKIAFPKIDPLSTEGAADYFQGKVFGFTKSAPANGVVSGSVTVEIETELTSVEEA
ncbi:hypothetical protein GQF56_15515 [Rhodobacter sphaeroides]|jgi:Phage tail protein.|uniref:Phage tail protein n=1 Tax=Cereibacter sphaeroides (strain ATCC 17023 / DSM 158 / JCM 6121 / CCUG 31486 / LMG 2827 / NBRC 12203 / NCIMB 8253 / ATH 2.4.1.) TaxID=272943 RepID=Q3IVQ4_CERS4|nr:phage tail tube protein [Cereibacter sphaeroides]ABA81380.1 Phage tail protein [Cereibacter sphaeroides 2.4.1]ACM03864.1 Hypothetical Protein RSKD131_4004 [Cereibacter sphaeroides KD131]AMJ49669.1 hypothetical protein APX01_19180 [Cereibacter sphaeroides]ANS36384.1 hypothetical protein A3858_19185 [Cereibacter sphaeroides]ATN65441.1 hypothetical protein A3857_19210 [Cereibacter sphaeroides]